MFIGDLTTQSLGAALRGLDAQRQAHEFNVANVETPGVRARRVEFADALRHAIASGDPSQARTRSFESLDPTRFDGNNVRLDHEITALEKNALHQQLVTEALNAQYRILRTTWS